MSVCVRESERKKDHHTLLNNDKSHSQSPDLIRSEGWGLTLQRRLNNTSDVLKVWLRTMDTLVPPPVPLSLAWQRCHREHHRQGWRDVEEENKSIVLGWRKR